MSAAGPRVHFATLGWATMRFDTSDGATTSRLAVALLVALSMGAIAGVGFQRMVGVGRILRAVGPPPARGAAEGIPGQLQGRLSIFALAGQSNMSGWAPLPVRQTPHPRAFLFGNDYRWRRAARAHR